MGNKIYFIAVFFIIIAINERAVWAADTDEILEEINFETTTNSKELTGIDFRELVESIVSGNYGDEKSIAGFIINAITGQISAGKKGFVNILILGIISAVFTNFARSFKNESISETGLFVTLLSIITLLFSCFYLSQTVAGEAINSAISFMKGAMPVLAMAVAVSGAGGSALVINELTLGLIIMVYWLMQVLVLKIANIYAAFSMVNSLSKDKSIGRFCKLFNSAGSWVIKTAIGLVIGIGTIQALVVPVADSLKANALTKALSIIPGIGNGVSAVSSTVIGASCLVKNSIGVAAFIVMLLICALPVIKLGVFVIMYKVLAAILEPVCDARIVSCVSDVATAIKLQLSAVAATAGLFMISLAIICQTTNVSYFSG